MLNTSAALPVCAQNAGNGFAESQNSFFYRSQGVGGGDRGRGGGCAPWLVSSQLNVWPNLTPPPYRQPKAYELRFIFKVENLRHDHVHLQHEKKIICDQIRKSATSPVLQGRFQCHKKQLARINVIDLK